MLVHQSVSFLVKGGVEKSFRVVRAMGGMNFVVGLLFWVLTLNNRLYQPRPDFVHQE